MKFFTKVALLAATLLFGAVQAQAACTPTGFFRDAINMTAALINPSTVVAGEVDATGCNIGVYYDAGNAGVVNSANIHSANYFGVLVNGDDGIVDVDVINSSILGIGENPINGSQHGVAVYYRGFGANSEVTGVISGNQISGYQKGGIVANGQGTVVTIKNNVVTGAGHVTFIAQNGIQVGYGATAVVSYNTVTGNSYIGTGGWASGGIIIVGGAGYGPYPYTTNTKVMNNLMVNNDVGAYLSNLAEDYSAPTTPTDVKVVNNTITSDLCYNTSYQAGISDVGNNDKLINNTISGPGYVGCYTLYNPNGYAIDADASFTNRVKVHATK